MLELGIGADIFRGVTWIVRLLFVAALAFALWGGKTGKQKLLYVALVLLVFLGPLVPSMYRAYEYKQKYAQAKVLFDERCKTAGQKIYRTVEDVDGILLLKVRPRYTNRMSYDPMYPGAAMIGESGGDDYIASFLRYEKPDLSSPDMRGQLTNERTRLPGYGFVEAVDPVDGRRYRYTATFAAHQSLPLTYFYKLEKAATSTIQPRYAVTYEDIVEPNDRKYWVAGTVLKVLDTETNEILAEQTRYLFDKGLGNTDGARSPWSWAASSVPSCPIGVRMHSGTRFFVDAVLKPKLRE